MAWTNLADGLNLEATQRNILRALTLARDASDRLVVSVAGSVVTAMYNGSTSTAMNQQVTPAPNGSLTWNLYDQREVVRQQAEIQWYNTRNRWTIT